MPGMIADKTEIIGLAAAPTFAIMALLTRLHDGDMPGTLCSAQGGSLWAGMVPMYLLMAAFHSPPWLRLILRRRNGAASKPGVRGQNPRPERTASPAR
jgi:hypothetical protein